METRHEPYVLLRTGFGTTFLVHRMTGESVDLGPGLHEICFNSDGKAFVQSPGYEPNILGAAPLGSAVAEAEDVEMAVSGAQGTGASSGATASASPTVLKAANEILSMSLHQRDAGAASSSSAAAASAPELFVKKGDITRSKLIIIYLNVTGHPQLLFVFV